MPDHVRGMSNDHRRKNFTPSDDALIRQRPVNGIGLKRLAAYRGAPMQSIEIRNAIGQQRNNFGVNKQWLTPCAQPGPEGGSLATVG
jgi:hypothetical protein